jgi:hypothetical protein
MQIDWPHKHKSTIIDNPKQTLSNSCIPNNWMMVTIWTTRIMTYQMKPTSGRNRRRVSGLRFWVHWVGRCADVRSGRSGSGVHAPPANMLYPSDLWHLIAQHVRPEDVGRYAQLCMATYRVTLTARFWRQLYHRCVHARACIYFNLVVDTRMLLNCHWYCNHSMSTHRRAHFVCASFARCISATHRFWRVMLRAYI